LDTTTRTAATIFIRPHDFEISQQRREGRLSIPATVTRIHSAGNFARVEMVTDAGETLTAETTHSERDELQLAPGGRFFMTPRSIRVFADDSTSAPSVEAAK
jgi:ABC-type sulfate/molybdate transport systems ATPase subunit